MTFRFKSLGGAELPLDQFHTIQYPGLLSAKIDGIRVLEYGRNPVTRSLKLVRNYHTCEVLTEFYKKVRMDYGITGLDGEITVGPANAPDVMQKTTSGIMRYAGKPKFNLWVFDSYQHANAPYYERLKDVERIRPLIESREFPVEILHHQEVRDVEELEKYEELFLMAGYEGAMYRKMNGHYKMGHSTLKQQILLKIKRFADDEAVIHSVNELMHNENTITINALGHSERKGGQAGLRSAGTLGSFTVESAKFPGKKFNVGMGKGFTAKIREELWAIRYELPGKSVKYYYFPHGVKDVPRFPGFISVRDPDDMNS